MPDVNIPDVEELLTEDGRRWRAAIDAGSDTAPFDGTEGQMRAGATVVRLDPAADRSPQRWHITAVAAAVVAAVMVLAGLAVWHVNHGGAPAAAGLNLSGAVRDPLTPSTGTEDHRALPAQVIPAPRIDNETWLSMPWKFRSISPDGRTIVIAYVAGDGDCVKPAGMVIEQQKSLVAIEIVSHQDLTRQACPSVLIPGRATITLDTPLGSRTLLHVTVSPSWRNGIQNL